MLESSLESDIWRSFNFKWGREACPELPCHCWGRRNCISFCQDTCEYNHVLTTCIFCSSCISPGNPSEMMKSFSRKTWLRKQLQNKHKSRQQATDVNQYKEKHKSLQNLQIACYLKCQTQSLFSSYLYWHAGNNSAPSKKLQTTMIWHRGRRFKQRLNLLQRASNMIWPRRDPIWRTDESALNTGGTGFQLCCLSE